MQDPEMKLLVVEDNDLDVIVLQRLMRRMSVNFPVVRARNGEEALNILRSKEEEDQLVPPFIMLVDINMPRMNGFELLEELANDDIVSQVPIYIMSTSNNPRDTEKAHEFSIRGYLIKPVTETVMSEIFGCPID